MNCATKLSLTRIQSLKSPVKDKKETLYHNASTTTINKDDAELSIVELFPWISEFKKKCRCLLSSPTMASLTELMQYYFRNVNISVIECYTNPLLATKLKESMSEILLFFLYINRWLFVDCKKSIYLKNMSDLLARYIDLELKVSEKSREDHCKISARLTSCLYIYLEHSTEHLLDTIIKIQFMCCSYHSILDPIIMKIVKNLPVHPKSNNMYIRYLLVYHLWKKINMETAVKNRIASIAVSSLGPLPSDFPLCIFQDVLPKVPKNQPNSIQFLLNHKFDIKKSCELFIQAHATNKNDTQSLEPSMNIKSIKKTFSKNESQRVVDTSISHLEDDNSDKPNSKPLITISNDNNTNISKKSSVKSRISLYRQKLRKKREIIVIDLTTDVISEKVKKIHRTKKIAWLKAVKKKAGHLTSHEAMHKMKVGNNEESKEIAFHREDSKPNQEFLDRNTKCNQAPAIEDSTLKKNSENNLEKENLKNKNLLVIRPASVIISDSYTQDRQELFHPKHDLKVSVNNAKTLSERTLENRNNIDTINENDNSLSSPNLLKEEITNNWLTNKIDQVTEIATKNSKNLNKTEKIKMKLPKIKRDIIVCQSEANNKLKDLKSLSDGTKIQNSMTSLSEEEQVMHKNCSQINNCFKVVNDVNYSVESLVSPKEVELGSNKSVISLTKSMEKVCGENLSVDVKTIGSQKKSELIDNTLSFSVITNDQSDIQAEFEVSNYCAKENDQKDCISNIGDLKDSDREAVQFTIDNVQTQSNLSKDIHPEVCNKHSKDMTNNSSDNKSLSNVLEVKVTNSSKNLEDNSGVVRESVIYDLNVKDGKMKKGLDTSCIEHADTRSSNGDHGNIKNTYLIQDTELQENIDGLSLLASVSERIPHLKAESRSEFKHIKVKDYSLLKNTSNKDVCDEEASLNDLQQMSQLCKNPTPELINRIVGICPEDALEKVALQVEISSTSSTDPNTIENETSSTLSYVAENSEEYNAYMVSNDLISVDTKMQSVKENTNVILNGDSVVLLQKSPNSNFYIINKAVKSEKKSDVIIGLKERHWIPSTDECSPFEVVNTTDNPFLNFDLLREEKEVSHDNKYVLGNKGIKVEPKEANAINLLDTKVCSKQSAMSTDCAISVGQHAYHEIGVLNSGISKTSEKRKAPVISSLNYGQSVKQEYNHTTLNCGMDGYAGEHTHPHDVIDNQHALHIPVTHPNTMSSIYANCPGTPAELYVPYHKHCTPVSCSLQINATASLHQHSQSGNTCGRSHCSCLNCTYDIVTHCRQCILPSAETHLPRIESNSYYTLPTPSPVSISGVDEQHSRIENEAVKAKLYNGNNDDKLLSKIEQGRIKKSLDNRLPFKKRLKVHTTTSVTHNKKVIRENLDNYPGVPMMSIAALEAIDNSEKTQVAEPPYEISYNKMGDLHNTRQFSSDLVRYDYCKDNFNSHGHHKEEDSSKTERIHGQENKSVYQEPCRQRMLKIPAQQKHVAMSGTTYLKQTVTEQEKSNKKCRKTQSSSKQVRSSKRKMPKVNYSLDTCYPDVEPEWNPSGESKRKRKKTSR
ncbi:uncharacterized protein [Prorops nasuta]|uniref:uncharacterized protein isoform X2 n=1 Tax=Prorops nasuta TaxID=863751 RepID=UPI0034CE9C3A